MWGSAAFEGPVTSLSESGLAMAPDKAPEGQLPPAGAGVDSVEIVGSRGSLPLGQAQVARREGATALVLTVSLDESMGALWDLLYDLEHEGPRGVAGSGVTHSRETLPKVPGRGLYTEAARHERLEWLREETGAALTTFQRSDLPAARLTGNIENLLGGIEVPVGIAGPLWIRGRHVDGLVYAPLATTEGSLVASATRGAAAISRSGGVATRVLGQQMLRAPLFMLTDASGATKLAVWLADHLHEIREVAEQVSNHARLIRLEPFQIGRMLHVRFLFETADAAGQNVTTQCTWRACTWILDQVARIPGIELDTFTVEANTSSDKKATFQSFHDGRGTRVTADCHIDGDTLREVLKVTPREMERVHQAFLAGSIHAGSIGHNINVANTVAAIFLATGQDVACVHESAVGQLHIEATLDGLYASLLLPGLIIGTVGGGTHLPGQQELLELLGCAGPGRARRLAEVIAGFALALDLSTLAAITGGQFASAHERFGRNKPVNFFTREDLSPEFFADGLRRAYADPGLDVTGVLDLNVTLGSSIITELTARKIRKLAGLFPLRLVHDGAGRSPRTPDHTDVVVKAKPLDQEVIVMLNAMAGLCGGDLADAYARSQERTGFQGCDVRELAVYAQDDPRFTRHVPRVLGSHRDDDREAFVLVLERIDDAVLIDTADDTSAWAPAHVDAVLEGLGEIHSIWLGRDDDLLARDLVGRPPSAAETAELTDLWEALADHAAEEFPELMGPDDLEAQRMAVKSIPEWWPELEAMPRTLVHNDCNPRNVALRADPEGPHGFRLCAYDWELATLAVPQHDLAEFLCFVLTPEAGVEAVDHHVDVHRRALERAAGVELDPAVWRRGFDLSLRDLMVNRFALYLMAHTFRDYRFMARVLATTRRLLELGGG